MPLEPVADLLGQSALFGALDAGERARLVRRMRELTLEPGQLLFGRGDPGEHVFVVVEGQVRISVLSPEGRELSFTHSGPGTVIGELAAFDGKPRSADATAVVPTRLKVLARGAFRDLLSAHPALAMAAIELLCHRLRSLSESFEAVALHSIDVRLARFLLARLPMSGGDDKVGRVSLELAMSQGEIALLIGTTRQRANAALAALEECGAIKRRGDQVECDVGQLRALALLQ